MDLEERLSHSLSNPRTHDMLRDSVRSVLKNIGWTEEELPEATELLMKKLVSHPAVHSGVTDGGPQSKKVKES
jgi:hypothetical protein